jgi:hypothetical protein
MQRFFFEFSEGGNVIADRDGVLLDDVEEAKREAMGTLCRCAAERPREGTFSVAISSENGEVALQLNLRITSQWLGRSSGVRVTVLK